MKRIFTCCGGMPSLYLLDSHEFKLYLAETDDTYTLVGNDLLKIATYVLHDMVMYTSNKS